MVQNLNILMVVGARGNFVKIGPLVKQSLKHKVEFSVFYVGQRVSHNMSDVFFKDLGFRPDHVLEIEVKNKDSKIQKGLVFLRNFFKARKMIKKICPSLVIVVGDVASSGYIALISKTLKIPVAHIEAGLRSFNNKMPEEKSRIIADKCSDLLFTSEKSANNNLIKEKVSKQKIFFVGNIMVDSFIKNLEEIKKVKYFKELGFEKKQYGVITFHRHENITNKKRLISILRIIKNTSNKIDLILPLHPSTKNQLKKFHLLDDLIKIKNLKVINPLGYKKMISLLLNSRLVITDSGCLQDETTFMKVPCLTLRTETERPATVDIGTNTIIQFNESRAKEIVSNILENKYKKGQIPKYWDGKTSQRIMNIIKQQHENQLS